MGANTYTWNSTTGNWGAPSVWSSNTAFPGQNNTRDVAVINQGTVSLNVNASINQLTVGNNGTLLLNQNGFGINATNNGGTGLITVSNNGTINLSASATITTTSLNIGGNGTFLESNGTTTVTTNLTAMCVPVSAFLSIRARPPFNMSIRWAKAAFRLVCFGQPPTKASLTIKWRKAGTGSPAPRESDSL